MSEIPAGLRGMGALDEGREAYQQGENSEALTENTNRISEGDSAYETIPGSAVRARIAVPPGSAFIEQITAALAPKPKFLNNQAAFVEAADSGAAGISDEKSIPEAVQARQRAADHQAARDLYISGS